MKTTRKRYSPEFKVKVALEAIRGDLTLAELAAKHGIHHTMIATWKRQAIGGCRRHSPGRVRQPKLPVRPIWTGCTRRSGSWWWNGIF